VDVSEKAVELPSDESLVSAAVAGDRAAFGALVDRYQRPVRGVCLAVLRDRHQASDAAQDAFVIAYRSLATLRDHRNFGGWITTIARNCAIRAARNRRPVVTLSDTLSIEADRPSDPALLEAVAALPEQERVVVMLRYFEKHDVSEVAAILARPLGTITKQLSRAHERLRRALASEDVS
jgi:RNA polymerase sigma-70 factor (ECF subfamily)